MLLSYVDLCAKRLFIGKGGTHVPIHESDYEVKKYYTTQCIETVFKGLHKFEAPEPIFVDEHNLPVDEELRKLEEEFVKEALEMKAKADAENNKEDAAGTEQAVKTEENAGLDKVPHDSLDIKESVDKMTDESVEKPIVDDTKKMHLPPPVSSLGEYRPRVYKPPEDLKSDYKTPAKYDEKKSTPEMPIPEAKPKTDPKAQPEYEWVHKLEDELTDQDKTFHKNQMLATLREFYRRFVEMSNAFEAGCHRGKELVRKMSTRRSRKCFKTSIATNGEGGTLLELTPNLKGEKDFRNVNTWFQEFCNLYHRRQQLFSEILEVIALCKRYQDSQRWKFIVGEPVFKWVDRIEKFLLSSGNEDLLRFIEKKDHIINELTNNTKGDGDVFKDALMFHFFNVSPKIIVQMAIAQPQEVRGLTQSIDTRDLCE